MPIRRSPANRSLASLRAATTRASMCSTPSTRRHTLVVRTPFPS